MDSSVLVVGASGFIGSEVVDRLRRGQAPAVGTYRTKRTVAPPCFRFELGALDQAHDVVILCTSAAAAMISEDDLRTWEAVLRRFVGSVEASRVVLLSTDAVFSHGGPYETSSKPSPASLYGKASALAEEVVSPHPNAAIIRTSYVFGRGRLGLDRRAARLVAAARSREPFAAACDAYRNPTQVQYLASEIERIALAKGLKGVFHAAGPRMSLYEHFSRLAEALELRYGLVVKSRAVSIGMAERDTSLIVTASDELQRARYSGWVKDLAAPAAPP